MFRNKTIRRLGRVVSPNTPRRLRKAKRKKTRRKKSKEVITKKRKGKKNTGKAIYKKAFLLKKERRKELSTRY